MVSEYMAFTSFKKRVASTPVVTADLSAAHGQIGLRPSPQIATTQTKTGALSRLMQGLFGTANPNAWTSSAEVAVPGKGAFYRYYEGDLFTPGTQNYVFEPTTELTALYTSWGRGFLRRPNTFNPEQPPQVYSNPNVRINGIGGLVAGQFALQGTESEGD
jgi:hypothetical protein